MFKETLIADAKILSKFSRNLISQDHLLGKIPFTKRLHSGGMVYKADNEKLEIPLDRFSAKLTVTLEDIVNFNIEKTCMAIYEFGLSFREDIAKTLFSTLSQVTDFTGNVVDGEGKGISHELIIEMIEKIDIGFDQDGKPYLPTIVIPPALAKSFESLKADENKYKAKIEEIIEKKRKDYFAKKGHRRLSRID